MRQESLQRAVLVLVMASASSMVGAQANPLVPYRGRLDQAGQPANGPHDFRFGLFATQADAAGCLVTAALPGDACGLWWTEVAALNVQGGAFSTLLGSTTPLNGNVLAQRELWLGIAVKAPAEASYTLLLGKQRIGDVPRSAAATDFTVAGALTVGATTVRGMQVSAPVTLTVATSAAAYHPSATAPAPTGYEDSSKSICFLTRTYRSVALGVPSSETHGECQVQEVTGRWQLYATASFDNTGNPNTTTCAMRCMRWDWTP